MKKYELVQLEITYSMIDRKIVSKEVFWKCKDNDFHAIMQMFNRLLNFEPFVLSQSEVTFYFPIVYKKTLFSKKNISPPYATLENKIESVYKFYQIYYKIEHIK